jgi:hypothetical protein
MNFRICDDGREQVMPATAELVERTFAPGAPINVGTEITLADGEHWLAAISVGAEGSDGEFLLSGASPESGAARRVTRSEALRHFRALLSSAPKA